MKKTYLLFLCLFSVLSAFAQAPDENRFVKTVLVEKLDEPMVMAYLPDGKILMIERKGDIKQFDPSAKELKTLAHVNVNTKYTNRVGVAREAEEGLMGLALDPKFKENH
jgi:cytochrome c